MPILTAEQDVDQVLPPASRKVFVAVDEDGNRCGETHHNAKFTDHEIDLIRELREGGMMVKEIAAKFECACSTISEICTYQRRVSSVSRWKAVILHIPTTKE